MDTRHCGRLGSHSRAPARTDRAPMMHARPKPPRDMLAGRWQLGGRRRGTVAGAEELALRECHGCLARQVGNAAERRIAVTAGECIRRDMRSCVNPSARARREGFLPRRERSANTVKLTGKPGIARVVHTDGLWRDSRKAEDVDFGFRRHLRCLQPLPITASWLGMQKGTHVFVPVGCTASRRAQAVRAQR
jgi:hypothetical protein